MFKGHDEWEECQIVWTTADFDPHTISTQKTKDHFSMLPNGWIPDNGLDFFTQLVVYLTEKWLNVCKEGEEHLSERVRFDDELCPI